VDVKAADIAVWVLLGIAMASAVVTAIGILTARNVYVRLHYMGPLANFGTLAVAAAIAIHGPASAGVKAVLAGVMFFVTNPILTHVTARAARIHEHGRWEPRPEEQIRAAGEEEGER
jgi:monovalent cation/proton antiporter MnhG/PhaG subunit